MDSIVNVTSGILKGAGKQKFGAVTNFVGYYVIGLPVGVALMMEWGADMKVPGYWWGQVIGLTVQSVVYLSYLTCKINWQETAAMAVRIAAAGTPSSPVQSSLPNCSKDEEGDSVGEVIHGEKDAPTFAADREDSPSKTDLGEVDPKSEVVLRRGCPRRGCLRRRPNHLIKITFFILSLAAFVASLVNTSIRYRVDLKYVPNNPFNSSAENGTELFNSSVFDNSQINFTDILK